MIPPVLLRLAPYGLVAALLALGTCAHKKAVHDAYKAAYAAGVKDTDAKWQAAADRLQAMIDAWKRRYTQKAFSAAQKDKEAHNAELRVIAARADALRLRGPGRIAAPHIGPSAFGAAIPAPASGDGSAARPFDDGVADVLDGTGFAIVPWGELVARAEQADANRDEVIRWRSWWLEQNALHAEAIATAPAAEELR